LRPPGTTSVASSLVEATLRSAVDCSIRHALVATGAVSTWSWVKRTIGFIATFRAGAVASSLVVCAAATAICLAVYKADGESARLNPDDTRPHSLISMQGNESGFGASSPSQEPAPPSASSPEPESGKPQKQRETIRPTRSPSAIAPALTGITIDGRLDDWPSDLQKHPIKNQLFGHPSYNSDPLHADDEPNAYFMAGYDPKAEQVYLAIVVSDREVVVHPTDFLQTDAVEIYIDGTFSDKAVSQQPTGDWRETLDAATMPVLQYVGVPGEAPAYGDPWDANPSLVYGRTRQTATKMQYQQIGDVITYEWSIKAYDRFPDRPTRLIPGKRLGLELAVVDKDRNRTARKRQPTFLTWGSPPVFFKGSDASSLGELILAEGPGP
jgi:hypothetical protein